MKLSNRAYSSALMHLARSYVAAAPRTFFQLTAGMLLDPKRTQRLLHHILDAADLEEDDSVLRTADIVDLVAAGGADIHLQGSYYRRESSDTRILGELASLAYLVRAIRPALVFELGTFVGRTTRLFALNAGSDAKVLTLDLPQSAVSHSVGRDYRDSPENSRITQLYGDSRTFDFSPWRGTCDFVWVDACHDYTYVVNDTRAAIELVRPGGWIGWHDYHHTAWWSGVTRAVRELKPKYPNVTFIRGTTTALLQVGQADGT